MSFLEANGVEAPHKITSYQWSLEDLSDDTSGEDLTGYTTKNIIRQKRHLDIAIGRAPVTETAPFITAISDPAVPVFVAKFWDLKTGTQITRNVYVGKRSAAIIKYDDETETAYTSGLTFSFIETEGDTP